LPASIQLVALVRNVCHDVGLTAPAAAASLQFAECGIPDGMQCRNELVVGLDSVFNHLLRDVEFAEQFFGTTAEFTERRQGP
jgi:hypothetical protein